jgi:hypothetical protein
MKKAQLGMEYKVTYGWAVIAVAALIAIGAYYGYSILPMLEKCIFPTYSGFYCDSMQLNTNSNITLLIKNVNKYDITLSKDSQIIWKEKYCALADDINIPGDSFTTLAFNAGMNCPAILAHGKRIKAEILLKYRDDSGFPMHTLGVLTGKMP